MFVRQFNCPPVSVSVSVLCRWGLLVGTVQLETLSFPLFLFFLRPEGFFHFPLEPFPQPHVAWQRLDQLAGGRRWILLVAFFRAIILVACVVLLFVIFVLVVVALIVTLLLLTLQHCEPLPKGRPAGDLLLLMLVAIVSIDAIVSSMGAAFCSMLTGCRCRCFRSCSCHLQHGTRVKVIGSSGAVPFLFGGRSHGNDLLLEDAVRMKFFHRHLNVSQCLGLYDVDNDDDDGWMDGWMDGFNHLYIPRSKKSERKERKRQEATCHFETTRNGFWNTQDHSSIPSSNHTHRLVDGPFVANIDVRPRAGLAIVIVIRIPILVLIAVVAAVRRVVGDRCCLQMFLGMHFFLLSPLQKTSLPARLSLPDKGDNLLDNQNLPSLGDRLVFVVVCSQQLVEEFVAGVAAKIFSPPAQDVPVGKNAYFC